MKKLLLALALLGVSAYAMHNNMNANSNLAFAVDPTSDFTIQCTEPTLTGDTLDAAVYTLSWSGVTPSVSAEYTNGVGGETAPSVQAALIAGKIMAAHTPPKSKVTGAQCQDIDTMSEEAYGTNETALLSVAYGDSQATFNSAQALDTADSESKINLRGGVSPVLSSEIADNGGLDDAVLDGVFNMGNDNSKYFQLEFDPIGEVIDGANETITFVHNGL